MTPAEYRTARRSIGRQNVVAPMLGVSIRTLTRREHGEVPITREMVLAIRSIADSAKTITIPRFVDHVIECAKRK